MSGANSEGRELKIGELAERSGVSVRSLRYYETKDMLSSARTPGRQRVYADDAVDRVILIQELFAAGLTSDDVVVLLPCVYSGTTTTTMVHHLRDEREKLDRRVRELAATRDRLDQLIVTATNRLAAA